MDDQNSLKRGSQWRKWDLHLHSPKTSLANNYNNCSTEEFVQTVVDADIKVVGLTNYFRFHEDDLGEIKQKLNEKGIVVFPNLEFRTQPQNKENDEMHIHIIFSDRTPLSKINGFLGRLKTVDDKYCKDLTQAEIETTTLAYDTLKTALENDKEIKHFEDYLLVACPRGYGNFRPQAGDDGRGNNFAITIDKKTDILFGNGDDTEFFLNTDRYQDASQKPVVCCSDAHKLGDIGTLSTWIKADPTFEGLKQILWEPKNRIKIQERNPGDEKPRRVVIDRLTYKDANGLEHEVLLNQDLNSIIGIRGSGKSTLLKNIAYTIEKEQFEKKDGRLYKLDEFKVFWGDGQENSGTDESPKSIFYIPQYYLSSLAYEESGRAKERDEFLTTLLKKNAKFANAIRAYEDFASDNKIRIEGLIEELLKVNQILLEAKTQLRKQGSRKEIENEINTKNDEMKKYQGTGSQALTDDEVKEYTDAEQAIADNSKIINVLEQDKKILNGLLESGADVYIANQEITRLSSKRQLALKSELLKKSKESLSQLIEDEVNKIDTEIKTLTSNNTEAQKVLDKYGGRIKANKALESLTKELGILQQTLKTIGEFEETIKDATSKKEDSINGLVDAYTAFDTQQELIFGTIEFDEDFSFLQIDIVTFYNINDLKKFVEKNINTIATSPLLNNEEDQDIRKLISETPEKLSPETVRKCINKFISEEIKLKVEAGEVGDVISQLLKNRYEIDFLNSVKTKDDGILFKNMTGGQKAIGMLELVFRFDNEKYPILIDQPEDDLDVSGVATDLVNFIKSEKNERQIIIVSHNGSLVVCADTEEVLVSNSEKLDGSYNFSYDTGAIENPNIREEIIKVLEGGKEALKQRARKLNFKHEI